MLRTKAPTDTDESITYYSNQLRSFDRYDFPEEWALCHVSLAKLFTDRKKGKRKGNIENALYHIENAMQVYKQKTHPLLWSDSAMMACTLFRERVGLHEQKAIKKQQQMKHKGMLDAERALENAEAAMTVLTKSEQPVRWARCKREIAFSHMKRFEGEKFHVDEQESIEICIRNLEECIEVFEELRSVERKKDKLSVAASKKTLVLTLVTGDTEKVIPQYELGKAKYVLGVTMARRHEGNIVTNYNEAIKNLEEACGMLLSGSPDHIQANAMLAKMHAGVDAPDAANAGEDGGGRDMTDDLDKAIKHLTESLVAVNNMGGKSGEWAELHWQLGYMYHLKLRKLKGKEKDHNGNDTFSIDEVNKEVAEKLVETSITHLSNALKHITPNTAPAPDRYCAINSVMAATHVIRADVLTAGNASPMDVFEAQSTLAEAVGHFHAACEQWRPTSYPEQYSLVKARIGETFIKMGELSKAANAYRSATLTAGIMTNIISYDKEVFLDLESDMSRERLRKPWDVWSKVGGLFEACAEICSVRALIEGGEDRKSLESLSRAQGRKESWIWVLDPDELLELEEAKRLAKIEEEKKNASKEVKQAEKVVKRKKKGMASWESGDDEYDATEDLGGEFDIDGAMKSKKRATAVGEFLDQKGRQLKADLLGVEQVKGKAYFEQKELNKQLGKKKKSGWRSIIRWGGGKTQKGAPIGVRSTSTPEKKKDPRGTTTPESALRKAQKDEAILASGFKSRKNNKGDVPIAPSHIKAPSMPPPASVLLTAAGAIPGADPANSNKSAIPMAPKGIRPPKGPPPKAMKSTVEEKFIKAVWNIDDIPLAPAHIRAPSQKKEESRFSMWLNNVRDKVEATGEFVRQKYEMIASIGKMYNYEAVVNAHPRALEALRIACRAARIKLIEGAKAADADRGRRAIDVLNHDLHYWTSEEYIKIKQRLIRSIREVRKLEAEVKKQKNEYSDSSNQGEKTLQWLSAKSTDMTTAVKCSRELENLLKGDISDRDGFLNMVNICPNIELKVHEERDYDLKKLGLPMNSVYPTEHDLLKSIDLYEAKILWFMSEEGGVQRDVEDGTSMSGDGKVGSQALFTVIVYRDLIRFTPMGKKINKKKSQALDRAEKLMEADDRVKDEEEMTKIRGMKIKDARRAMRKRKKRITKRERLKRKGNGYVRVPGDVKVKLLCCEAKDGKKGVEVAISAYLDASRTKQYHKRGFLLERALKFLGDSLGLSRILDMMPHHIDSLCLIPQGPLRLAPLHALPIPTSGSRQYRGDCLIDRYSIRYCSSFMMSDFCDIQSAWAAQTTPWHYHKMSVVTDPVPYHKGSKNQMRLAGMEGRVAKMMWSNEKSDSSFVEGIDASTEVALTNAMGKKKGNDIVSAKSSELVNKSQGGGDAKKANMKSKKLKDRKAKAQVLGADGRFHDMSDGDSGDDNSDDDSSDDSDEYEDEGGGGPSKADQHMKYLSKCRCLHLTAPLQQFPEPTILLSPSPSFSRRGGTVVNNVAHYKAKDILKNLHLKHCGLVFLSRGGTAEGVQVANEQSSLKAKRAIGIDICDSFIYSGAQSVIAPLWSDEASALSTVLITAKFYDDVVDCADEMRPVSVAMRNSVLWLRDATFSTIRNFMWGTRIDRLLLEEIDDELWSVALAQKMLKGQGKFKSSDDRWERVQVDARPFASPFYWATFRCIGSCTGVHDPRVAERDEFDDFRENAKMEAYLEEFHQKDGEMEGLVEKGVNAAKAKMKEPIQNAERKIREAAERVEGVKQDLEINVGQKITQAKLKGEAAKEAIRESREALKDVKGTVIGKIEKKKKDLDDIRRKRQAKKINRKFGDVDDDEEEEEEEENSSSSSESSSDDEEEDNGTKMKSKYGSVNALRKARNKRKKKEKKTKKKKKKKQAKRKSRGTSDSDSDSDSDNDGDSDSGNEGGEGTKVCVIS